PIVLSSHPGASGTELLVAALDPRRHVRAVPPRKAPRRRAARQAREARVLGHVGDDADRWREARGAARRPVDLALLDGRASARQGQGAAVEAEDAWELLAKDDVSLHDFLPFAPAAGTVRGQRPNGRLPKVLLTGP